MKDARSALGPTNPALAEPERETNGSARGEIGYPEARRRYSNSDSEPSGHAPQRTAMALHKAALLPTSACLTPSPLPELRAVQVRGKGGSNQALALVNPSELSALKSSILAMNEDLKPAGREEIAALLARLFSHYPQQQSGNTMTAAEDWINDMSGVSAAAFRKAVEAWRKSTERFKPTPGQLLALIEPIEEPVRTRLATAQEVVALEETMTTAERLGHFHHWLYEVETGAMPLAILRSDPETRRAYTDGETARLKAEIAKLEAAHV